MPRPIRGLIIALLVALSVVAHAQSGVVPDAAAVDNLRRADALERDAAGGVRHPRDRASGTIPASDRVAQRDGGAAGTHGAAYLPHGHYDSLNLGSGGRQARNAGGGLNPQVSFAKTLELP